MFERLFGKLLNNFISKYFVQNKDGRESKHEVSVWSGYVSLENLEVKRDVVNESLQRAGLPLEVVSISIRTLEITIPWAKLASSSSESESAVVVVVVDGVHALIQTKIGYDDELLRRDAIASRRSRLVDSETFGRSDSFSQFVQKRIKEGILKDIMERLHVHIRDVHIRFEDVVTDPLTPSSCGITLESLSIQADHKDQVEQEDDTSAVIRKEIQLNHFALYCNALDYGDDVPVELSVLSRKGLSLSSLVNILDKCITRRGTHLTTPQRSNSYYTPNHSYLLSPVIMTCRTAISADPKDFKKRPSFVASIHIDDFSIHVRDCQLVDILRLSSFFKEHKAVKQYRPYRPQISVKENPRAWWQYAIRIVRFELRESRMRWSWSRFNQRLGLRRRYCYLYERSIRYPSNVQRNNPSSNEEVQAKDLKKSVGGMKKSPSLQSLAGLGMIRSPSRQSFAGLDMIKISSQQSLAGPLSQTNTEDTNASPSLQSLGGLGIKKSTSLQSLADLLSQTKDTSAPDAGAGPTIDAMSQSRLATPKETSQLPLPKMLTQLEHTELKEMEDGSRCDLSIRDIILYRAIVNARLAGLKGAVSETSRGASLMRKTIGSMIRGDHESEREYERLITYLDKASQNNEKGADEDVKNLVFLRCSFELDKGCISLYSPLLSTSDQKRHRRLHRRFMNITMSTFLVESDIFGNCSAYQVSLSLQNFTTSELRANNKECTVLSRSHNTFKSTTDANDEPLLYVQLAFKPPQNPEHDIRFHATVNAVEIFASPDCEWIHRLRRLIPSTDNRQKSSYYNRGSNRWSMVKAQRQKGKHKHIDIDVRVDCPILHVAGQNGFGLTVDLGKAYIKTKNLAGVANERLITAVRATKDTDRPNENRNAEQRTQRFCNQRIETAGSDDTSFGETSSFRIAPLINSSMSPISAGATIDHFDLGSQTNSFEEREFPRRSLLGMSFLDSSRSATDVVPSAEANDIYSSFYDKFQARLSDTKVIIRKDDKGSKENVLNGIDIIVSIAVSVIPNDSSLCPIKTRTDVSDIIFSITKSNILEIRNLVSVWKESMSKPLQPSLISFSVEKNRALNLRQEMMADIDECGLSSTESSSVDENEFLDVFEDNEETWSENNWDIDDESVILTAEKKNKHRKTPSVSDVSSISDASLKRTKHVSHSAYLSAENLARLEEGGGDDEDEIDSDIDGDSFHSALSFRGRRDIAQSLLKDIEKAEKEVDFLTSKLSDTSHINDVSNCTEIKQRRQARRGTKLALDRTIAELRAMRASVKDLEVLVDVESELNEAGEVESTPKSSSVGENVFRQGDLATIKAQSILRSRRKRTAEDLDEEFKKAHREYFQASFVLTSVCLRVKNDTLNRTCDSIECHLSRVTLALTQRSSETKAFFGVDNLTLSTKDNEEISRDLLRCGSSPKILNLSRPAVTQSERFLRVASHLFSTRKHAICSKAQTLIGLIEISPEADALTSLSDVMEGVNAETASVNSSTDSSTHPPSLIDKLSNWFLIQKKDRVDSSVYHDIFIRLNSLRVCLRGITNNSIGTMILTDAGNRITVESISGVRRLQHDAACGNFQLYYHGQENSFTPKELISRRDHYGQIFRCRLRLQASPRSKANYWVIGHIGDIDEVGNEMVIDCHMGFRLYPVQIIPSVSGIKLFLQTINESKSQDNSKNDGEKQVKKQFDLGNFTSEDILVRWRLDISVQKLSILIPGGTSERTDLGKLSDSALQLLLSMRLCAEDVSVEAGKVSIRAACHDISLVRSIDDWPIVENLTVSVAFLLPYSQALRGKKLIGRLLPSAKSHWSENDAMLTQCPELINSSNGETGTSVDLVPQVSIKWTAIKINLSPSTTTLLLNTLVSYKNIGARRNDNHAQNENRNLNIDMNFLAALEAPDFKLAVLNDNKNNSKGGLIHARPLFSIASKDLDIEIISRDQRMTATVFIADFRVCDLCSQPGVLAVGLNISKGEEKSDKFVLLEVKVQKDGSRPTVEVNLRWGKIKIMLLPTLFDSVLAFTNGITHQQPSKTSRPSTKRLRLPETMFISFSLETDEVECILPTRNILEYIREGSKDPIHVVTLRWASSVHGSFCVVRSTEVIDANSPSADSTCDIQLRDQMRTIETLTSFVKNQLYAMEVVGSQDQSAEQLLNNSRCAISAKFDIDLKFHVVRTCVNKITDNLSTASIAEGNYVDFLVAPPAAGEQRITNPFGLTVKYRLFGTSFSECEDPHIGNLEVSQAFQINIDMVDALVYIQQSAGGIVDAYNVTIQGISAVFKSRPQLSDQKITEEDLNESQVSSGTQIKEILKRASTVGSANVTGLKVTLVPGGATRLTESPIIQFAMKKISAGFACIDVPANLDSSLRPRGQTLLAISGALRGKDLTKEDHSTHSMVSHMTMGCWLQVDLSAHYHNRRLVAWEPLLEHWTFSAKSGIDLVRVMNLVPCVRDQKTFVRPPQKKSFNLTEHSLDAGDRLRELRKLLGSTFSTKQVEPETQPIVTAYSDMPYLLLVSLEPTMISSAFYPSDSNSSGVSTENNSHEYNLMSIPGERRIEWLKHFGHPCITGGRRGIVSEPAIQCSFFDKKPLNINFTGALIENLASHLSESISAESIIPHWIRNDSGLTIRFTEVLDQDRVQRKETPSPATLASGREIPLSLKRAASQFCAPHRARITLELGSFEETVGRVNHSKYNILKKGSRGGVFFYKAFGRIPVDTVGIHTVSFYENSALLSQSEEKTRVVLGKIIVRISLKGGVKLVSIESPVWLCNSANKDLSCAIHDDDGISLLWSSRLPKFSGVVANDSQRPVAIPIPADLLPALGSKRASMSINALAEDSRESALPSTQLDCSESFSRNSIAKGIISETEISMISDNATFMYLAACSLRIGSANIAATRSIQKFRNQNVSMIPEQRMLLLRPPLVVTNHLPVLMHVQVRTKTQFVSLPSRSSVSLVDIPLIQEHHQKEQLNDRERMWEDLGIIACGRSVCWTGAQLAQEVEMRIKLLDVNDKNSNQFPSWSSVAIIKSDIASHPKRGQASLKSSLSVLDQDGTPLTLSVHADSSRAVADSEDSALDNVKSLLKLVDQAPRVVTVAAPYWIVNTSDLQLEFLSNKPIAGQFVNWSPAMREPKTKLSCDLPQTFVDLGLSELAQQDNLTHSLRRSTFGIIMIGDEMASRLTMRQKRTRSRYGNSLSEYVSPWCDPLSLHRAEKTFTNIDIFPQGPDAISGHISSGTLSLRSEMVKAPWTCGGRHGTRIIHIFNRYKIVNEMGRDLEIVACHRRDCSVTVKATGQPVPFHFNDSSKIQFRPKEFGWIWSGKISTMRKRREVTLRLVHRLRGQVIVVRVEFLTSPSSPSTSLVFRLATPPPFRLENHTMYAFRYGQSSHFVTDEESQNWQRRDLSRDSTLLPYQHAEFAWDEPDEGGKAVTVELGDIAYTPSSTQRHSTILGTYALEKVAPGSYLKVSSDDFVAQIVVDGPTRVLRITDAHLPAASAGEAYVSSSEKKEGMLNIPSWIEVRLCYGIGVSIIDWTPQELLYINIPDMTIERAVDDTFERVSVMISNVSVDNQLWVTSYPVLLKIGRQQLTGRRRRTQALELEWRRLLAKQGGLILFTDLDLAIGPITIRVDELIANSLLNMAWHPFITKSSPAVQKKNSLESEIQKRLGLGIVSSKQSSSTKRLSRMKHLSQSDDDFFATAAIAAKLFVGPQAPIAHTLSSAFYQKEKSRNRPSLQKFYIKKMRISNVKTEISWTGSLPKRLKGLPNYLRPPFTFESLPLLLRKFTSYHVYGTMQEVSEGLKQHYLSIWRVFDLLVGLTFTPTFLVRAYIFTTRETIAALLDQFSQRCSRAEEFLINYRPMHTIVKSLPTAAIAQKYVEKTSFLHRAVIEHPTLLMATTFRTWAMLSSSFAASLRYREPGGILGVRVRSPRLFANFNGKELLVDYVEGSNAGKALLSRVRAGLHLGEVYVFHSEPVYTQSSILLSHRRGMDSVCFILMITLERVLLLDGDRKKNFCQVLWEATFHNLVKIELLDCEIMGFNKLQLWHLADREQSGGSIENRIDRFADSVTRDEGLGLDTLKCRSIYVPYDNAVQLEHKLVSVFKNLFTEESKLVNENIMVENGIPEDHKYRF